MEEYLNISKIITRFNQTFSTSNNNIFHFGFDEQNFII